MAERNLTYFLSDTHLGAAYIPDRIGAERRLVRFLRGIAPRCKTLYLLGDILDFWFEFSTVAPRGYARFFGQLAQMADDGIRIVWFTGNHDIWLFDYLRDELGIEIARGSRVEEICGRKFYLAHGDLLGPRKPGVRFISALFRNRLCQKLFAAVHPRWTVPLGHQLSSASRGIPRVDPFRSLGEEPQAIFAMEYLRDHPDVNFFVFGHRHVMVDEKLSQTCRLIILGDWIMHFSYAIFDGNDLKLLQYESKN
ncbi:MAG: UDP-2,3-diacylglucosamine diphosphatase [Clostridium sp.]|nr:UDP-2,3-diacylglucosamine diphosphatase [Clostridium sp.]